MKKSVFDRGLKNGSSTWLLIGAFGILKRLYQRGGRRSEQVALAERIRPGDELIVRYPGAPARKTRKEITEVKKRRTAEQVARDSARAALLRKAERGGWAGRKAAKQLARMLG
jgi:hypothetical protein